MRRDVLEAVVLGALRERLMDPGLFRVFVAEFTAKWNRLQAEASAGLAAQLQALVNAFDGMSRAEAARAAGMDRQTLRDRVIRFMPRASPACATSAAAVAAPGSRRAGRRR